MLSLGLPEILLILAVALVFLGPERLPEVARQVGKVVGDIRRTTDELRRTLDMEIREDERNRRLDEYRQRQRAAQEERDRVLAGTGEAPGELPGATEVVAPEPAPSADDSVPEPAASGEGDA